MMEDQIIEHKQSPSSSTSNQGQDTEAAPEIPVIPDELIVEILTWLPVKSLSRFKCVSRAWLALISSPEFIRAHLSINSDVTHHKVIVCRRNHGSHLRLQEFPVSSVLYGQDTQAASIQCPEGYEYLERFAVVGSCHGLICVSIPMGGIILWNPSIRKCRRLPDFDSELHSYNWLDSIMSFGYGYDELNDDHKVVGMLLSHSYYDGLLRGHKREFHVKMYSSRLDCWRRIESFQGGYRLGERGYFASGKLHWRATPILGPSYCEDKIVSIDLANGMCEEMEFPKSEWFPWDCVAYTELGIVGGCLSVFGYFYTVDSIMLDIWIMKDYGVAESWARLLSVDYSGYFHFDIYATPVFLSKKGEFLFKCGTIFAVKDSGHYSPSDPGVLDLLGSGSDSLTYPSIRNLKEGFDWAEVYVESLVWPDALEEGTAD